MTDTSRHHRSHSHDPSHLWFGIIAIIAGVLFTLDNLDIVNSRVFFRLWPILFIVVGLNLLFNKQKSRIAGSVFLIVGFLLLLANLDYIDFNVFDLLPLLLVLLGVRVIQRHRSRDESTPSDPDAQSTITASGVLSGVQRTCSAQDFKGGQLTAFMGGCEIDLRDASIGSEPAVIDIFVMWGGVELKVPEDWRVSTETQPILGGVVDRTRAPKGGTEKSLILKGSAIMGGVEVRN